MIHVDSDILGGTPVFWGTRVPVKNLFDYLETGETVDDFLKDFESVQPGKRAEGPASFSPMEASLI